MTIISVEIPEIILASHNQDTQAIKTEIQYSIVIWEYLNGHLSLRQCSDVLQISYRNLLELLMSKGIPLDGLSQEEVQEQVDYLYQCLKPMQQ